MQSESKKSRSTNQVCLSLSSKSSIPYRELLQYSTCTRGKGKKKSAQLAVRNSKRENIITAPSMYCQLVPLLHFLFYFTRCEFVTHRADRTWKHERSHEATSKTHQRQTQKRLSDISSKNMTRLKPRREVHCAYFFSNDLHLRYRMAYKDYHNLHSCNTRSQRH